MSRPVERAPPELDAAVALDDELAQAQELGP